VSIKNDGHYFCRAGGNRPDGLNEPVTDNTMVLGNTQARGLRTYGCIQDADAQREGINASARYPKNWVTTGDPAREFTMIQSAPLMLLADPDEFVSVQLA
uniref:major capsid protein n=1 Tax=Escherichia coli TaxID=562 RepID=UPI001FCE8B78